MNIQNIDRPDKTSAQLHTLHPQPGSADKWLERWHKDGGIWIPGSEGMRPIFLTIERITPTPRQLQNKADYWVEAQDTRPFYIKFAREQRAFSPLLHPTLVIPHYSLKQAWWLLSAN